MTQEAEALEAKHFSVMLNECIENLNIKPDGVYLDGTLGMGGHSYQIASRLGSGRLICIDRDETAIERAGRRLAPSAIFSGVVSCSKTACQASLSQSSAWLLQPTTVTLFVRFA